MAVSGGGGGDNHLDGNYCMACYLSYRHPSAPETALCHTQSLCHCISRWLGTCQGSQNETLEGHGDHAAMAVRKK